MSPNKRYGRYIFPITAIIDFLVINLILFAVLHFFGSMEYNLRMRAIFICVNFAYLPALYVYLFDVHTIRALYVDQIVRIAVKSVFLHACCFIALLYILHGQIPIKALLTFYLVLILCLPLTWVVCRLILKRYRKSGYNYLKVVVIGTGPNSERLTSALVSDPGFGYRILAYFGPKPEGEFKGNYMGDVDALEQFIVNNNVDEIYFTISGEDRERLKEVMRIAETHVVRFNYVPHLTKYIERRYEVNFVGSVPVLTTHPTPLSSPINRFVKRAFDIVFSGIFLIFSPILFIPIAIAIKISSPGPIFFKQKRTGYKGKEFTCLKFRTMRVNEDADKIQATKDDPRKTKVGEFLRKTSLDELPQFINVFLGDMSVVGPRPHMLKCTEEYSKIIEQYMVRHTIKTGITGLAQVSGYRGEIKEVWQMKCRVEYDIWYAEHWSFLLDLKIIFRTVINVFTGDEQAY